MVSGLAALMAVSCINTLDTHPVESYDEATVWGSRASAEAFINATAQDVLSIGYGGSGTSVGWQSRTPDGALASQVGDGAGNYDGLALEWARYTYTPGQYALLRRCNMIIEKVEASNMDEDSKKQLVATGHLLRGLVFFDAARKCGRFVPITKLLTEQDEEYARTPMTKNEAESYEYVIADLQKAAADMPLQSAAGVPNRYAALVLLSRASLQAYAYTKDAKYLDIAANAASEVTQAKALTSNYRNLFNQYGSTSPEILWAYYRLSNNTTMQGYEELMRTYPNIKFDDLINHKCPIGYKSDVLMFECWAVHFPTQDMVDQYLVVDEQTGEALPWWETSQYRNNVEELDPATLAVGSIDAFQQVNGNQRRLPSPQDFNNTKEGYANFTHYARLKEGVTDRDISDIIYQNRDARFDGTIIHDKSTWLGETIETKLDGNLSQGCRDQEDGGWYQTATGYYWLKGIAEPETRAYAGEALTAHYVVARVGEAYMNLAEAELLRGNIQAAVAALNATRTQHGGLPESKAATAEQAWADYMRERRVEMANECGDIYFSYLRWGKYGGNANYGRAAGDVIYDLDRPVYKIQMSRDRKTLLVGQLTISNAAQRTFTTKRYLLPITQSFLDTREAYGLDHDQTPNW